jgi:hypothetical protein
MIYLSLWLIAAACSFYLLKNYVSANLRQMGIPDASIAGAMRNAAKKDKTIDPMHDCPDHIASALFWTILLVYNLLCWPFCLCALIWWKINPQNFSDFKGE